MDFGTTSTPTILSNGCTASLLTTGRHVITAAHCTDFDQNGTPDFGSAAMVFDMPNQNYVLPVATAGTSVPGAWPQTGGDVAVIELPVIAPFPAERFEIYRGTDEDGQRYVQVGYGNTGTGATGSLPSYSGAVKRIGHNEFVANGDLLYADFDDGLFTNDTLGDGLGLGLSETTGAQGTPAVPHSWRARSSPASIRSRWRASGATTCGMTLAIRTAGRGSRVSPLSSMAC